MSAFDPGEFESVATFAPKTRRGVGASLRAAAPADIPLVNKEGELPFLPPLLLLPTETEEDGDEEETATALVLLAVNDPEGELLVAVRAVRGVPTTPPLPLAIGLLEWLKREVNWRCLRAVF